MTNETVQQKRGFTLIEVIIAIFIFVIIMTGVSTVFAQSSKNYRYSRLTQQAVEDAQFAMNRIAKVLRTSTVKANTTTSIIAYDYSRSFCVRYKISGDKITEEEAHVADVGACSASTHFGTANPLTNRPISGRFAVIKSDNVAKIVGKVSMVFVIETVSSKNVSIQTSVSLRDYAVSGLL